MNRERLHASRRRFLRSVGATAAMLPFLRSLPGFAQGQGQTKLVLMFSGNGRVRHLWGADGEPGQLTFRQNLAALQPLAQYITVTQGVRNFCAPVIGGTHEGGMMSLFTGSKDGSQTGGSVGYPSIDTLFMAQATGSVRDDSLYQQIVADLNSAQNAGPTNRCIFDATGVPRDPLRSCWEVMEQYMAGAVQGMMGPSADELAKQRASTALFQSLNAQMGTLVPKLCAEDRAQLEGMRDALEKAGQSMNAVSCTLPTLPTKPNVQAWEAIWAPPADASINFGQSSHWYRERSRLAIDLLVAALACGVTRSGVLQYDQAASVAKAVGQSLDHHNTSHQNPNLYDFVERLTPMPPDYKEVCLDHQDDPPESLRQSKASVWAELSVWENYYAEEFGYLVSQLQSHGVLDDTLILWGSEIDSGQGHAHYNMPFLIASGQNIPIKRGQVVRFPISYDKNNQNGCIATAGPSPSHNDLFRTLLQALGTPVDRVGSTSATPPMETTRQLNQAILTDLLA
ncbi:MAG TPA: DUF1552 domain-containing protein [Polyangiaceae bacterium]